MSNAIFQFIKILVLNDSQEAPKSEDFLKAMSNNYYLDSLHQHVMDEDEECDCHEHHHQHEEEIVKAASLCEWSDRSPEIIDQLPIGALFKGVTKDSLMYSYQVVAKTKDGKYKMITMPIIRWRVVCAFEVMIDRRSPTSAFINVDLPTFGLPIIFTKPDLCIS